MVCWLCILWGLHCCDKWGLISKWFEQFGIRFVPSTIVRGSGKHTVENGFMVQVGVSLLLLVYAPSLEGEDTKTKLIDHEDLLSSERRLDVYSRNFPN